MVSGLLLHTRTSEDDDDGKTTEASRAFLLGAEPAGRNPNAAGRASSATTAATAKREAPLLMVMPGCASALLGFLAGVGIRGQRDQC